MAQLLVRLPLINLEQPWPAVWIEGNPFMTALLNAFSMAFPAGEDFFIRTLSRGLKHLPAERVHGFRHEVRGFMAQEAVHRRLHGQFNAHLAAQGQPNEWDARLRERFLQLADVDVRHAMAVTAAIEHFTTMLADWLLAHPEVFEGVEERLCTLWMWHAAEESEHRSTAFEMYRALDGDETWRRRWFYRITCLLLWGLMAQTLRNLRASRTLWSWRTWTGALGQLCSRDGLFRSCLGTWWRYRHSDFHPGQMESGLAGHWLQRCQDRYRVMKKPLA